MTNEESVRNYYSSDEFAERQKQIASGEVMPRVYIQTCRWTTFLKHCAADFHDGFKQLGCESLYMIEENDVQELSPDLVWRTINDFRPDFVFMISFARSAMMSLPKELPFIAYMQDRCGPTLTLPSLSECCAENDLFVCMYSGMMDYLADKGVPRHQMYVMPVPADEKMFYPVTPKYPVWVNDIAFVNHGKRELYEEFSDFTAKDCNGIPPLVTTFTELYKRTCFDADIRRYESEFQDYLKSVFTPETLEKEGSNLSVLMTMFYVKIYQFSFRSEFMIELNKAGLKPAIYGNGWTEHKTLRHLAHGPINRELALNAIYNQSKINLNIHAFLTMHQRVSECGLAGGFMMVADHDQNVDECKARDYFEDGKEIVFFDTKKDLVDKCRYYLEHENERRDIAEAMHKRAINEQTCKKGAARIIREWKRLLNKDRKKIVINFKKSKPDKLTQINELEETLKKLMK